MVVFNSDPTGRFLISGSMSLLWASIQLFLNASRKADHFRSVSDLKPKADPDFLLQLAVCRIPGLCVVHLMPDRPVNQSCFPTSQQLLILLHDSRRNKGVLNYWDPLVASSYTKGCKTCWNHGKWTWNRCRVNICRFHRAERFSQYNLIFPEKTHVPIIVIHRDVASNSPNPCFHIPVAWLSWWRRILGCQQISKYSCRELCQNNSYDYILRWT